jgi:hypothetical protein
MELPMAFRVGLSLGVGASLFFSVPVLAQERVDQAAIDKIKAEALERSQIMETASWLTDVYGARLTGSPNIKAAGEWAAKKLTEWGMVNARLEPWGYFGRGCPRPDANAVASHRVRGGLDTWNQWHGHW